MIPEKRSPIVEIPVTFDSTSKPQGLSNSQFYLSLLVFGVWIFAAIVSLFVDITIFQKLLFIVGSFIVVLFFNRYVFMREHYFKKKRNDLLEKDYQYPYSVFWNIYEVTNSYPTICRYANGLKSIFVVFDKDVIVGKETDSDYNHYEAIAEAYLQMHKRGIECIHIDYMDTVGKDNRVKSLFNMANETENEDLKDVLLRIFDNVEYIMQHSYASYDVYCFFYNGKDELFMDELEVVLDAFLEANYIRYRILDKLAIGELVKSVFNINEFSVRETSERLFSDLGGTHYLTPIWVERETSNGVERVTLNKTSAQKEAERATREAEKVARKNKKKQSKAEKYQMEMDLEDFTDDYSDGQDNGYSQGYGYNQNYGNNHNNSGNQGYGYNQNNGYNQGYVNKRNQDFSNNYDYPNNSFVEDSSFIEDDSFDTVGGNSVPQANNSDFRYDGVQETINDQNNPILNNRDYQSGFEDVLSGMSFDEEVAEGKIDFNSFAKGSQQNSLNYNIDEDEDEDLEIL